MAEKTEDEHVANVRASIDALLEALDEAADDKVIIGFSIGQNIETKKFTLQMLTTTRNYL